MRTGTSEAHAGLRAAQVWLVILVAPAFLLGSSRDSAAPHFAHASQLAQNGKIGEAEREYRVGLALDPHSAEAYNNLAALYFRSHQFREATVAFRRALDLRPGDATISFNLGLALFSAGEPRAAVAFLVRGSADPKHTLDAHLLIGACYFDLHEWAQSIHEIEIVRQSRAGDPNALFILAKDYRSIGEPSRALQVTAELLKTHPNSPYVYEMLGEAYDMASQPEKAEKELRRAIAASPQVPELHFMLGYLYWRWKRYSQAVEPLETETRISPNLAQPYFYLGDVALRYKQFASAEKYFRDALRLDPSYGDADLGMGRALAESGHYQRSIPFLRLAASRLPESEEAHYWLGKTLIRIGRKADGEKELAEVKVLDRRNRQKASNILHHAVTPPFATSSGTPGIK